MLVHTWTFVHACWSRQLALTRLVQLLAADNAWTVMMRFRGGVVENVLQKRLPWFELWCAQEDILELQKQYLKGSICDVV